MKGERRPLDQFRAALDEESAERDRLDLRRELRLPAGIDFASNDYLSLSRHEAVGEAMRRALAAPPFGAPASRLLRGTLPPHLRLERRLAEWKGTAGALFFSSGYAANLGALGALIGPRDRALSDRLNHASLIDGLRLGGARREVYPHLDRAELERRLREPHPGGRTFVVTETLFSMDGDQAPLAELCALAERHGALVILDDSHATGLYGERGSGLAEAQGVTDRAAAIISTCGKALGLSGAFVAGPAEVIDCLVNRARTFLYSTAPPPVLAAGIEAALEVAAGEPGRRRRVLENAGRLRGALASRGIAAGGGEGPIVPVVLGENRRALQVSRSLADAGYDVRAIRPPTVPEGTARLRISVHADHTEAEIDGLAAALARAIADCGLRIAD
jgi:8-amino-7-oxononanoate synthase